MPQSNPTIEITPMGTAGGPQHDKMRIYTKVFTLSGNFNAATGYSLDISEGLFNSITGVQMNPVSQAGTVTGLPIISEKSRSTAAIVVNIMVVNSQTVNVLGTNVTGLVFATNLAGMSIDLRVEGT